MLLRFDDTVDIDDPLYARYVGATAGIAGLCPECDDSGVVYSVERPTYVQNQRCPGCGYRWQYRFDAGGQIVELRELAGQRLDLLAPSPQDIDVLDLREESDPAGAPRAGGWGWWRRSPTS